jgi:hypothetical protein
MFNRYQTGPFITLLVFVVALGLIAIDLFEALHSHHRNGWIGWTNAAALLLFLFFFDRHFKRDTK